MTQKYYEKFLNPKNLGRVKRLEKQSNNILKFLKKFSKILNLKGISIAIDCANGAGYKVHQNYLNL